MPIRPKDAEAFRNLIVGLAATFGREADVGTMMGFEMALEDLPMADIRLAVGKAIRECEFMPTGAVLRRLAGVLSPADRAALAWGHLKKAVASHGAYRSIDFDDQAINATIRNLGGWERLCAIPNGDEFDKWLRKDFERVYQGFLRNGCSAEMAAPLVGICDRDNSAASYIAHVEQPLRIETGLQPGRKRIEQLPERKRINLPPMQGTEDQ